MKMEHRSYSGQMFRPKPEIHLESDGSLLVVATPWGSRSGAKRVISAITDFFLSAKTDFESTSPFEKLDCLSATGNNLRSSVLMANDLLFQEENKNEYLTGCELLVCAKIQNELLFIQTGQPQIFLCRTGFPLIPISAHTDLALNVSPARSMLSPLPQALLGLTKNMCLEAQSIRFQSGDRLVLLSRSLVPPRFLSATNEQISVEFLSSCLSQQDGEMPFWLGLLTQD